ncbi:MAG: hypothetical protein KME17_06160 [Cyanosarcina radialis HA8281-LM2]|nr:hypothetical protein [Cyanosarcina radialis HA8281-LM2]
MSHNDFLPMRQKSVVGLEQASIETANCELAIANCLERSRRNSDSIGYY